MFPLHIAGMRLWVPVGHGVSVGLRSFPDASLCCWSWGNAESGGDAEFWVDAEP